LWYVAFFDIQMSLMNKNPKPSINEKWFRDRIEAVGLSQRKVAKALGINPSSISHMFKGNRKMPLEEAALWAELLKVTVEEILLNAGVKISSSSKAFITQIEIDGWVDGLLSVHWTAPKGPKTAPNPLGSSDIGVLRCQTLGSPFEGMDGALLYYYDTKSVNPDCLERLSLVEFSGKSFIRIVKRGYEPGKYNLTLSNGTPKEEGIELERATPIVWMKL
jgi:transcriptional regulator with XRE-family HTH domain